MLDCYNQAVAEDISVTITTRISESNNYFVMEKVREYVEMPNGNICSCRPDDGGKGVTGEHIINTDNIAPTLIAAHNIMIKEPTDRVIQVGNTTPTAGITTRDNPQCGRVYDPNGIAPTINTMQGGNREPQIIEPISCAIRTRSYMGQPAQLEVGNDVANAITSVQKDSKVVEPVIQNIGNIYPSEGQGGKVISADGIAPTVCECHGEVTRIAEPLLIPQATKDGYIECPVGGAFNAQYLNQGARRGRVQQGGEFIGTLTTDAEWLIYEGRNVAYKEMPNGNIRAYNPNTPDQRGISEMQITNPENVAPTVTTSHEPKIIEEVVGYRIRKLTEREVFRLMDLNDNDIDKILNAKGNKGKRLISKSQCYKLAGNSIVVSCLYHIFRKLFVDTTQNQPIQQSLFN